MKGSVILVGAGPGDPGLLTLRGREALGEAETVVYDRLVSPEILKLAPPDAKLVNVGKTPGCHPVPQEEISRLLLEEAQKGRRVVRLKGGDPFLFGRGGEELELLAEHGIPFEVVPGVTSALAVPAYGGIPVTHRDFCSSVHVITGRFRDGSTRHIDFEALVHAGGTLVFLMAVASLPEICSGLLEAGLPGDTPAAVIENGTTPEQRKVLATAATLAERAAEEGIVSPAVSVFGAVCSLSERFDWYDRLPMKGETVVVTRPAERMGDLPRKLRELGARVIEYPCIRTAPCRDRSELDRALENLNRYRWLVFTSPGGPEYFFRALSESGKDARALGGLKLAAIGAKTAEALNRYGLHADLVPEVYDSVHLGELLCRTADGPVLLCRSSLADVSLPEQLEENGIPCADVPCYETIYESPDSGEVMEAMKKGRVLVTFTSASTVRGFVQSLPPGTDLSGVLGCCIGKKAEREAERYQIRAAAAGEATMESLVQLMMKEVQKEWI